MTSFEVLRTGCSVMALTYVVGFFWARGNMDQNFLDWLIQRAGRMSTLYKVLGAECAATILVAMWV